MHLIQPARASLPAELLHRPVFAIELLSGLMAIIFACLAAFKMSVPGESNRSLKISLAFYCLWLSIILSGYLEPLIPASMAGKRETCYFEALYYSIPLSIALSLLTARRF